MADITSFETLDMEIENVGGKPVVLEALWGGDTRGWSLLLYVYTVSGFSFTKRTTRHFLGHVALPEEMEQFTDGRPSVSFLAEQFGSSASKKYNLTFYFPSPKHADEDCPTWEERHLAITCADCHKLIIPTDSPYLPKDICYDCHLTRERDKELKDDEPCDEGVHMYMCKDGEYEHLGYSTYFDSFTIAPFIDEKVKKRLTKNPVDVVELGREDIIELKCKLEDALSEKLKSYTKPVINERMRKFLITDTIEYKGKDYEITRNSNHEHMEISNFIYSVQTAEKAIAGNYIYKIYFKNGFTYRDDHFLRFIHYVCQGATNIVNINSEHKHILTDTEIMRTLKKLEQVHCVTIYNGEVSITQMGRCLVS
ncbi:hypothetical protein [Chitinophaga filiformis]|uniref:Uncharacterized protein n=1 Tax=Chitinophaga filiformis TaxID=104663 RepID=A0ABY4HXF2_CHIFI|nr:hypothetical protein [Chitinophaga filiformis]UPK68494.1 hypothetical protein MYF79_26415 [Chitinophaga filiformis]